jgi:hypothetical protein
VPLPDQPRWHADERSECVFYRMHGEIVSWWTAARLTPSASRTSARSHARPAAVEDVRDPYAQYRDWGENERDGHMNKASRRASRAEQTKHRAAPLEEQKAASVAGAIMLVLLVASGLVLASSWFVPWPSPVFWGAVFIGAVALGWVLLAAYRSSRTSGDSSSAP